MFDSFGCKSNFKVDERYFSWASHSGVTGGNNKGVDRQTYPSIGTQMDKDEREVHLEWNYLIGEM